MSPIEINGWCRAAEIGSKELEGGSRLVHLTEVQRRSISGASQPTALSSRLEGQTPISLRDSVIEIDTEIATLQVELRDRSGDQTLARR